MSSWCKTDCRALTRQPGHHYFGYYDKCPYDETGRYLLALETDFMERPPSPDDVARIGIVDLQENGGFQPVAETRAFNWQQGTHLQWLPAGNGRRIIYNVREGDRYAACIHDLDSGDRRLLPLPIYAVSHDGTQAVTLNFSRLHDCRPGYGYNGIPDAFAQDLRPAGDGIYRMDLETGDHELIVTVAQIAALEPTGTMGQAKHRFNHLQFSTDDSRFVFLHRWQYRDMSPLGVARGMKRVLKGGAKLAAAFRSQSTRMFTARPDGSDIHLLNPDDMTSHFDWMDERHLLAWARQHGVGDRYFLFTDRSDEVEVVGEGLLDCDGHCTYSPDRRFLLTDTYPQGAQHLRTIILYNLQTGERIDVGGFYSPPNLQGEIRCDLHPRFSRDGRKICFDSMHEGHRQLYGIEVGDIVAG